MLQDSSKRRRASDVLENTPRKDRRYVGKDVPKIDSIEKLTGQALYTGDLEFAGMLHGKVLRSPHAKAKIVKIDTTRAQQLAGVHAVLTGKDLDYRVGLYLVTNIFLPAKRSDILARR